MNLMFVFFQITETVVPAVAMTKSDRTRHKLNMSFTQFKCLQCCVISASVRMQLCRSEHNATM